MNFVNLLTKSDTWTEGFWVCVCRKKYFSVIKNNLCIWVVIDHNPPRERAFIRLLLGLSLPFFSKQFPYHLSSIYYASTYNSFCSFFLGGFLFYRISFYSLSVNLLLLPLWPLLTFVVFVFAINIIIGKHLTEKFRVNG